MLLEYKGPYPLSEDFRMFPSHLKIFTSRARPAGSLDGGVLLAISERRCLTFNFTAIIQGSNNRDRCPDESTPCVGHLPLRYPLLSLKSPVANAVAFVIGKIHGLIPL